jgi:hypothetical protein
LFGFLTLDGIGIVYNAAENGSARPVQPAGCLAAHLATLDQPYLGSDARAHGRLVVDTLVSYDPYVSRTYDHF